MYLFFALPYSIAKCDIISGELVVPVSGYSGEVAIRFYITAIKDGDFQLSGFLQFTQNSAQGIQPIGTVALESTAATTLTVPETTNQALTCATPGAKIYYNLIGDDSFEIRTLYTGPIKIDSSTRLLAYARKR